MRKVEVQLCYLWLAWAVGSLAPEGPNIFALTIGQSITHTIFLGLKTLAITIG